MRTVSLRSDLLRGNNTQVIILIGNTQFDGFIGLPTQNVSYITATRINQTCFAVVASNKDINTSTLYIMENDLTIRSSLTLHVTTSPVSFTLASDGTYLFYGSCFNNASDFCSVIKYDPSNLNAALGIYEVPSYTDMSITYKNNTLIVLLQVAPSTKAIVILSTSNMQPIQSLASTTIANYFTQAYPVFAQGTGRVFCIIALTPSQVIMPLSIAGTLRGSNCRSM